MHNKNSESSDEDKSKDQVIHRLEKDVLFENNYQNVIIISNKIEENQ